MLVQTHFNELFMERHLGGSPVNVQRIRELADFMKDASLCVRTLGCR